MLLLSSSTLTVLPAGCVEQLLLVRVLGNQAVDLDLLLLPDAVATCHSLRAKKQHASEQHKQKLKARTGLRLRILWRTCI